METLIAGRYEVIAKLGAGGFGAVYKVRHIELDEVRAVKLLQLGDDAQGVARFREEARAQLLLRHDNIVWVSDFGRDGDQYYLVMDYIDGPNLKQYVESHGRLKIPEALAIARQLASALAYAHERGLVHRDVKPSNVLLASTAPPRALLFDFGIAKVQAAADRTSTGTLLGSPAYSAPEQFGYRRGKVKVQVSPRTDVFSLGLVVYEMCAGHRFWPSDLEPVEIMAKLVYESEALVPDFPFEAPRAVYDSISRAIRRDPDERFASMGDMLAAIDACLRGVPEDGDRTVRIRTSPAPAPSTSSDDTDDQLEERIRALERERQRRVAQAARAKLEREREQAEAAEAASLEPALFERGVTQERAGSEALEQSQYRKAGELFDAAGQIFAEAASVAAGRRAERDAAASRDAARKAKEAADRGGASETSRTLYGRASASVAEADGAFGRGAYDHARQGYAEAARLFAEAGDVAQRKRQEAVERARAEVGESRSTADRAGAPDAARTMYGRAVGLVTRADGNLEAGAYDASLRAYTEAAELFAEAARQARDTRARRADEARTAAGEARRAAEQAGAGDLARVDLERAVARVAEAEEAAGREAFEDAERAFREARVAFDAAAKAGRAAREQEVERAAGVMRAARDRARAMAAAKEAREAFGAAQADERRAEQARSKGNLGEAQECFVAAARAYDEATEAARRHWMERVDAAWNETEAARAAAGKAAAGLGGAAPNPAAEARYADAEEAVRREAYQDAIRAFADARTLFDRAAEEAQTQLERAAAEERARAERAARDERAAAEERARAARAAEEARARTERAAEEERARVERAAQEARARAEAAVEATVVLPPPPRAPDAEATTVFESDRTIVMPAAGAPGIGWPAPAKKPAPAAPPAPVPEVVDLEDVVEDEALPPAAVRAPRGSRVWLLVAGGALVAGVAIGSSYPVGAGRRSPRRHGRRWSTRK